MPIRIYALAKELKIDSKDLVDVCTKAGISGKGSALASLDDSEVERVRAFLAGPPKKPAPAPERPRPAPVAPVASLIAPIAPVAPPVASPPPVAPSGSGRRPRTSAWSRLAVRPSCCVHAGGLYGTGRRRQDPRHFIPTQSDPCRRVGTGHDKTLVHE